MFIFIIKFISKIQIFIFQYLLDLDDVIVDVGPAIDVGVGNNNLRLGFH